MNNKFAELKLFHKGKLEELEQKLSSNIDLSYRVKTAIQALEHVLPVDTKKECKNSGKSEDIRKAADVLFLKVKKKTSGLLQVWELYSKSIAFAENDSQELALAYANRSAVLCNLTKYEECVRDIDKALKLNYPEDKKLNLLRRKIKCLKFLKNSEADDVYEEAKQMLKNLDLGDDDKKRLKEQIENTKKINESPKFQNSQVLLPDIIPHEKIPSASNAINIKFSDKFGRYIVANRDLAVGEIIAIEKPYIKFLKEKYIYSHCSYCFLRAWNGIPCPNCVYVIYCSEKCRDEAWEKYHDIECYIEGYLINLSMRDLGSFGLKLALIAIREAGSIDKLRKEIDKIDNHPDQLMKSLSNDGYYYSDIYKTIYCLETHKSRRRLSEIVSMTINAAVILYFLFKFTTFFKETDMSIQAISENDDAIFVGKLIVHNIMLIQINDIELGEVVQDGYNLGIGAAVFAFSSLFNHSCNPNATRIPVLSNDKEFYQIIVTQHPIKKGKQIFDDYGFDFSMKNIRERTELCKQYYFECCCKACKLNWPLYSDMPSVLSVAKSKRKEAELLKILPKITELDKDIIKVNIPNLIKKHEQVIKGLSEVITTMFDNGLNETKECYRSAVLLRQAFLLIFGNKFELSLPS